MIPSPAPLLAILMAVVLALTSATDAIARGHVPIAGQMVICSGDGVITIAVDANGNPTQSLPPCPDCTISVTGTLPNAPVVAQPRPRRSADEAPRVAQCSGERTARQRQARAPPMFPV